MSLPPRFRLFAILPALLLLLAALILPSYSQADAADYDVPNGHFYTQASGSTTAASGYIIADDGTDEKGQTIKFWSEFQRLGGVQSLGYPASRRFQWNGFTCQVMQRVVLQWRSDTNSVAFVNVMDLITQAGKDDYLYVVRQTPNPANFASEEQGMTFQQIETKRFALLDAYPALKAKFFAVGDPLALNGLPTAPVTDMGNAYVLRAQRVILQQWKIDMPWAKAGDVTVALGGDIAKETGLIVAQDTQSIQPGTYQELTTKAAPSPTTAPAPAATPTPPQKPASNQWVIQEFRMLTPCENHSNHDLFITVLDAGGKPLNGVVVVLQVVGTSTTIPVVSGDKGPGLAEVAIWEGMDSNVAFVQGGSSDVTPAFTTKIWGQDQLCPSGGGGNTTFHYSYKVVFKKAF